MKCHFIYDGLIHCIYSSYSNVMDARTVQSGYRVILFVMVLFTVALVIDILSLVRLHSLYLSMVISIGVPISLLECH